MCLDVDCLALVLAYVPLHEWLAVRSVSSGLRKGVTNRTFWGDVVRQRQVRGLQRTSLASWQWYTNWIRTALQRCRLRRMQQAFNVLRARRLQQAELHGLFHAFARQSRQNRLLRDCLARFHAHVIKLRSSGENVACRPESVVRLRCLEVFAFLPLFRYSFELLRQQIPHTRLLRDCFLRLKSRSRAPLLRRCFEHLKVNAASAYRAVDRVP
uniref:F-box domain-containing protein n=1 Tax=Noctiluca scintillans TaxID=2966 RepID=A0A7S1F181_NOCSC|mmetsp:Transcript_26104/g.68653  ORF Transcript_26104/g.68653 Transcript_26104/m.68653 type:complete len:212 (+) Transcript_26104:36-671(+)